MFSAKPKPTDAGRILLAKCQTGAEMRFTRVKIGSGYLGETDPNTLLDVVQEEKSFEITSIRRAEETTYVKFVLANDELVPYYFRELALMADDPEAGEIAYLYGNDGDNAELIGTNKLEREITLAIPISKAENITITIPSSATVDREEFEAHVKDNQIHITEDERKAWNDKVGTDESGKINKKYLPDMEFIESKDKGAPNGVATLDENGVVPDAQLPGLRGDPREITIEQISESKSWIAPKARKQWFRVLAVGGGGGGGGGYKKDAASYTPFSAGGGGGGGGYVVIKDLTIAEGTTVEISCGAGGDPGANGVGSTYGKPGGNGGETKFGSFITAPGGSGGGGAGSADNAYQGGNGGSGGSGGGGARIASGGNGSEYGGGGGAHGVVGETDYSAKGGNGVGGGGSFTGLPGTGTIANGGTAETAAGKGATPSTKLLEVMFNAALLQKSVKIPLLGFPDGGGGIFSNGGKGFVTAGGNKNGGGGGGGGYFGDGGNGHIFAAGGGGGFGGKGGDAGGRNKTASEYAAGGGGGGGLFCNGADGGEGSETDGTLIYGGGGGGIADANAGHGGRGGCYILYFGNGGFFIKYESYL